MINTKWATLKRGIALSGTPSTSLLLLLLLLLLELPAVQETLDGHVLRMHTASSHTGSIVCCTLVPLSLSLLRLLPDLPALPLLLLVRSRVPGQFPARAVQSTSRCSPVAMSVWWGK
jgi:hypothetical protein